MNERYVVGKSLQLYFITTFDTSALNDEKIKLEEELDIVAEQVNEFIAENARKAQNQDQYKIKYTSLLNRFNTTKARLDEIKQTIIEK